MFKKYSFTVLLFAVSLFFSLMLFSQKSYAGLNDFIVYPHKVELDFSNGSSSGQTLSKVINIENLSKETIRIKAYAQDWNLSDEGNILYENKPTEFSLSPYLKFNPREFEVAPGQRRIVRLNANIPQNKDGEYRTVIFFESVNPRKATSKDGKLSVGVNFKAVFGVVIYAYTGKINSKVEITDLKPLKDEKDTSKKYLAAYLKNEGNIHQSVSGKLKLVPENNTAPIELDIPLYLVLPGRNQISKIELPAQVDNNIAYKAMLKLSYKTPENKTEYTKTQSFFKGDSLYTPEKDSVFITSPDSKEDKAESKVQNTTKKSKVKNKKPNFISRFFHKILPFI